MNRYTIVTDWEIQDSEDLILPKFTYRFNAISIKTSMKFSKDIGLFYNLYGMKRK